MIEFAAPLCLLGLLAVPVLRFLHRSGAVPQEHWVASLDAWPPPIAAGEHGSRDQPPDPAWRRRALLAAVFSLALAAPSLPPSRQALTLWIDDTPSLGADTGSGSRIDAAVARFELALGAQGDAELSVRRLSDPWRRGELAALRAAPSTHVGEMQAAAPPNAAFDPTHTHWLISDGTNAAVAEWLPHSPIARVFQPADAARNVGLTRLAARPSLTDVAQLLVELRIANGSAQRETRRVLLQADGVELPAQEVQLDALATRSLRYRVPAAARSVRARLAPADSLARDDALVLSTEALAPFAIEVAADCPAALRAAMGAHPGLRTQPGQTPALAIDCGAARRVAPSHARLQFVVAAEERRAATPLRVSEQLAGRGSDVPSTLPLARGGLAPEAGPAVLQSADGTALVAVMDGPRRVSTTIATDGAWSASSEFALWMAWLVDLALEQRVLERIASTERGDDAARVAPRAQLQATAAAAPRSAARGRPLLAPLLALAAALLAWELLALLQRLRQRRRVAS